MRHRQRGAAGAATAIMTPRIGVVLLAARGVERARLAVVGKDDFARATHTAVVERGPFVRDVAATGLVVAAVSPTLFAEAPGTISIRCAPATPSRPATCSGIVDSAALTNEYERERAHARELEAALNRQTIEVRRPILKSSQDTDLAKVAITAAEREFKRAEDAWNIHVIPERDLERAQRRPRDGQAQLRACRRNRRAWRRTACSSSCAASARSATRSRCKVDPAAGARGRAHAQVSGGRHRRDAQRSRNARRSPRTRRS